MLGCPGPVGGFEGGRGKVSQRRVQSLPVVEDFDILEHRPARVLARGPEGMQAQLAFKCAEEALLGGVVPDVTLAGHAGHHPLLVQRGLVVATGVLNAAVRVVDQSGGGPALGDRILQSNRTRRVDFALFMVDALQKDELIHEAPAIVGCQTPSALAHVARD